jgi:cytochrome c-type protein NapC
MIGPTGFLLLLIGVTVALVAVLMLKPSITVTRGGKILAFVSLFIFPVLSGAMGASEHMERSKTTEFCLKCHVMEDYGKSLHVDDRSFLPAAHYQNNRVPRDNACFTCHTDYTMFGDYKAKLRGLRHVYIQYFGKIPEKISLYTPYKNRECLHCHNGARSFEEGATHNMEPGRLASIKTGDLTCLSSGCHESVHRIPDLKDAKFWPAAKTDEVKADGDK